MKYCIVSFKYSWVIDFLRKYSFNCINTLKSNSVSEPISDHADVLYLKNNKTILMSKCQIFNKEKIENLGYTVQTVDLKQGYKTESKLNVVNIGSTVIYNPKTAIDIRILNKSNLIKVNQGYTKCSTIAVNENCFITEDTGIHKALKEKGKKCLLIKKGEVILDGYDYGFIGGASAAFENNILFFGDITKHSSYEQIKSFCKDNNINIDYIKNKPLTDIGGIVEL